MTRGDGQSLTSAGLLRLTESQRRVFAVLTNEWKTVWQIVTDAGLATQTARDSAGRIANELVKLDLAEKCGPYHRPVWRQSKTLRNPVR